MKGYFIDDKMKNKLNQEFVWKVRLKGINRNKNQNEK